jgi:AcrR family transcriptional regulator
MSMPVKRTYNSPRRRAQAQATRREILDAARRLFERQGYEATTIAAIAAEAGVALKTVYLAFETKGGIVRELWNVELRGGENEAPIAEHPWYREALTEADPERQLRLNARNSRAGKERVCALFEIIRAAAPTDPDVAALRQRIDTEYHANQRAIVQSLQDKDALKSGLSVEHAADILWTINHPSQWQLLVGQRGWTPEEYEEWSADAACSQLLA